MQFNRERIIFLVSDAWEKKKRKRERKKRKGKKRKKEKDFDQYTIPYI